MRTLKNILSTGFVAGTILIGSLTGCANKVPVDCAIVNFKGHDVLYVEEMHKDLDRDSGTYLDIGVDGKLDIYFDGVLREGEYNGVRGFYVQGYQIIDDSELSYKTSEYFTPAFPPIIINRNTERARKLQKQFETFKKRCKSIRRLN